jgi:hypothetical protein
MIHEEDAIYDAHNRDRGPKRVDIATPNGRSQLDRHT